VPAHEKRSAAHLVFTESASFSAISASLAGACSVSIIKHALIKHAAELLRRCYQSLVAMGNLKTVLEASGSSMENLLQVRVYVRGELNDSMAKVVPVLYAFLGDIRPALTGVGVASLASPELLVEIEAIAQLN